MPATNPTRAEHTDALSSLEDRILRAVKLVGQLRAEKEAAETQARAAKAQVTASEELRAENARLQQEIAELREERKQVRARIEKLLGQFDSLDS